MWYHKGDACWYIAENGGNICSVKTYAYTTGELGTAVSEKIYTYGNTEWKDLLTNYNGVDITYDTVGNPLNWINGETFTWGGGRQLTGITKGDNTISYTYNDSGIRTNKTVNGTRTDYYLNGTAIIMQKTGDNVIWYTYDENGNIAGMNYNGSDYWFYRNAQNDVIGIVDSTGAVVAKYTYDDWGKITAVTDGQGNDISSNATHIANINPIRYRGYYYDAETGLYYLQSRYYDAEVGRFLNADSAVAGLGGNVKGYNLFAYCFNNPINMSDSTGKWPEWMKTVVSWLNENIIQPVKNLFSSLKQKNVVNAATHGANRRPYTGEPGSTYTAPNGDSRTYGSDGTPKHDYDHDDHGRPDQHPHDANGGHNHDWENGVRGPAYSVRWEPIAGVALVTVCIIGIVVIAADDATGIGVADDFLLGPLGAGIGEGVIMIFG